MRAGTDTEALEKCCAHAGYSYFAYPAILQHQRLTSQSERAGPSHTNQSGKYPKDWPTAIE